MHPSRGKAAITCSGGAPATRILQRSTCCCIPPRPNLTVWSSPRRWRRGWEWLHRSMRESIADKGRSVAMPNRLKVPTAQPEGGLRLKGEEKQSKIGEPLVSIITATFNAAEHLPRTIKSIRELSYKNVEWIVMDGASKDKTIAGAVSERLDQCSTPGRVGSMTPARWKTKNQGKVKLSLIPHL